MPRATTSNHNLRHGSVQATGRRGAVRQDGGVLPSPTARPPHVRPARPADAEAIGAVQARSWLAAYSQLAPRDVLNAVTPQRLAAAWSATLAQAPSPAHAVQVAIEDDRVVGVVACDDSGEIATLVVDPSAQRRGHGSRLLAATAEHARAHAVSGLGTWCPDADTARRDFFCSAGFQADGGRRELAGVSGEPIAEEHLTSTLSDPGTAPGQDGG